MGVHVYEIKVHFQGGLTTWGLCGYIMGRYQSKLPENDFFPEFVTQS